MRRRQWRHGATLRRRVVHGQRPDGRVDTGALVHRHAAAARRVRSRRRGRAAQPTDRHPTGTRRARPDRRSPAPRRAAARAPRAPADASDPAPPRAARSYSPMLQRVHQRQHALQVEDRVRARARDPASAARAFAVARPTAGVATTSRRSSGHDQRSATGSAASDLEHRCQTAEERRRRVVGVPFEPRSPPPAARRRATGPVTRSNTRRPATVAAALLPRPAAIGMSLVDLDDDRRRSAHPFGGRSRRTRARRRSVPAPAACSTRPSASRRRRRARRRSGARR